MQMLFAPVTHLVERFIFETLLTSKMESLDLLNEYKKINSVHNRKRFNFVLENLNKK
jgi:hypothetical protein